LPGHKYQDSAKTVITPWQQLQGVDDGELLPGKQRLADHLREVDDLVAAGGQPGEGPQRLGIEPRFRAADELAGLRPVVRWPRAGLVVVAALPPGRGESAAAAWPGAAGALAGAGRG